MVNKEKIPANNDEQVTETSKTPKMAYSGPMTLPTGFPCQSVTVTKANALIVCQNTLTASQIKILNAAIAIINPMGDYDRPNELGITVALSANQISELTKISKKYLLEFIDDAAQAFQSNPVRHPSANPGEIDYINIALRSRYDKNQGLFHITFHPMLVEHLINLNLKRFTSYHLRHQAELDGRYQILLYELIAMHYNRTQGGTQYRKIDLASIYFMLGLTETMRSEKMKFGRFAEFRRRILDPSCASISQKTNFKVSYETYKNGRSVAGLVFEITPQWIAINQSGEGITKAEDALMACGVNRSQAEQWVLEYGNEVVESNVDVFKNRAALGDKIKNPTAYLSSLLKKNVADLPPVANPFSDRYKKDAIIREFIHSVLSSIWWQLDENLRSMLHEHGVTSVHITEQTLSLYVTHVKLYGFSEAAEAYDAESVLLDWNSNWRQGA